MAAPRRKTIGGSIGKTANIGNNPCGQDRPAWDQIGRLNDLINCYIPVFLKGIRDNLPYGILAFILIIIMLLALYQLVK